MNNHGKDKTQSLITSAIGDDRVRGLVGGQISLVIAPSTTVMQDTFVSPPALAYNMQTNLYYLRVLGSNYGTIQPESLSNPKTGLPLERDPDIWVPIVSNPFLYVVNNKTELDNLKNTVRAPAVAYRRDNNRYYYLIGPSGYGGRTGTHQAVDSEGRPIFSGTEHITAKIYVAGENTWNMLYTSIEAAMPPTACRVKVGNSFTVEGCMNPDRPEELKVFRITAITRFDPPNNTRVKWRFTPEFNMESHVGAEITVIVAEPPAPYGPITSYDVNTTPTTQLQVIDLTGPVFAKNTFRVEGDNTIYTIEETWGNVWVYTPSSTGPFKHGKLVTMTNAGVPVMEVVDPDIWICNSHLYEDNSSQFL